MGTLELSHLGSGSDLAYRNLGLGLVLETFVQNQSLVICLFICYLQIASGLVCFFHVMIKTLTKSNKGRKGLGLSFSLKLIVEGKQDRN